MSDDDGIFDALIGRDGAKAILRAALRTGETHVLLSGPPASGKSVALEAIEEHVPGARLADTMGYTERELRDEFARDPDYLCLDEFDKVQSKDTYNALNMPLEAGRITKDTNAESYDREVDVQVFAAANGIDVLPAHTVSRFRVVELDAYTYDEYEDVCAVLLPDEADWVGREATARAVAEAVHTATGTTDPRDARDAAKLADTIGSAHDIARAMSDADADIDSDPLTPDELQSQRDARERGGADLPTEAEWNREACPHFGAVEDHRLAYEAGRFLCAECAETFDCDPTTPYSEATA